MTSSRFAVAVHILALHAMLPEEPLTSEFVAGSVCTNPVVVRRLLGLLRKAGMVEARSGPRGGSRLVRDPGALRLSEIYRAVEDEGLLAMHRHEPNPACPVGARIQGALSQVFEDAEAALIQSLEGRTLGDVLSALEVCAAKPA